MAQVGIEKLKQSADMVIPVSRQKLFDHHIKGTPILTEFDKLKAPLYDSVRIISDIIQLTQLINIDLADLRLIMSQSSAGFIGEGIGSGDISERSRKAVDEALSFPLTVNSIEEAKSILFNITGGKDLSMHEIADIANIILKSIDNQAQIKFGVEIDDKMQGKVKVTIIAAGIRKNETTTTNQSTNKTEVFRDTLNIPAFMRRTVNQKTDCKCSES